MQDAMMHHLMCAFTDPKFSAIIHEFYELQGHVCIVDGGRERLVAAVETLLDTIANILSDEHEMNLLDSLLVDPPTDQDTKKKATALGEILQNVEATKQFIADDSGFDYMLLALWLFRTKIIADQSNANTEPLTLDCNVILSKLDTVLALIGLSDVSTTELWTKAARLGTRRDTLWMAVKGVLVITEECCSLDGAS